MRRRLDGICRGSQHNRTLRVYTADAAYLPYNVADSPDGSSCDQLIAVQAELLFHPTEILQAQRGNL